MNKCEKIYIELKKRLDEGIYPAGSRFPSESTLADEFAVNKMTMNKVVTMLVNSGFLQRGIRGAGTRVIAPVLRMRGSIAFLSPLTEYAVRILHGVYAECARSNFAVIVESPSIEDLSDRMQLLRSSNIAGVVSATYGVPLLPENMNLACVDSAPRPVVPGQNVHFINSCNFQGGEQIMQEILRRGHREILIYSIERFNHRPDAPKTPRVCGFHEAMQKANIPDTEERTFYGAQNSLEDAKHFLRTYLQHYPNTTLIACDSDPAAELIHTAALQLNLDCPGSIALTGFGNVTKLPIGTVNQNPRRQGELAARFLIDAALHGTPFTTGHTEVETTLANVEYIPINLPR